MSAMVILVLLGGASGCSTTAAQRAAFGRSVSLEVQDTTGRRPFEVCVAANERLLSLVDPVAVLREALERCPGATADEITLTVDPGLVRPGALRAGRFSALAPGAPPGGEAATLPRGVAVAGRLRLQCVVEHSRRRGGAPRGAAQAVADFSLAGAARPWTPLLRAIADVAAEHAARHVVDAARDRGAEVRTCE